MKQKNILDVGRVALHEWVRRHKPETSKCEKCGRVAKLELSNNNNHNYTRNIEDYEYLCHSCHKIKDMKRKKVNYSKSITIRLSKELYDKIEKVATVLEENISTLIRDSLGEYFHD